MKNEFNLISKAFIGCGSGKYYNQDYVEYILESKHKILTIHIFSYGHSSNIRNKKTNQVSKIIPNKYKEIIDSIVTSARLSNEI